MKITAAKCANVHLLFEHKKFKYHEVENRQFQRNGGNSATAKPLESSPNLRDISGAARIVDPETADPYFHKTSSVENPADNEIHEIASARRRPAH
jgi:hypothetical protein